MTSTGVARPTIRDIARVAGVSSAAVSFALNDKPGVAEPTRRRILAVAGDLGWRPNAAARALSAAKASAAGLVIARPQDAYAEELFHFRFLTGVQDALQAQGLALVLQLASDVAAEAEILRSWWMQSRVDGVILLDPRQQDPRPAMALSLGMPAVMAGIPAPGLAGVRTADEQVMVDIVEHLAAQGYRRVGYLGGPAELGHVQRRITALGRAALRCDLEVVAARSSEPTEDAGRHETAELLASPRPPDALVFDNEILALGGLTAVQASGRRIGPEIGLVSCEDSPLCRMSDPAISAVQRDPAELGRQCATVLLGLLDGETPSVHDAPPAHLAVRASTSGRR